MSADQRAGMIGPGIMGAAMAGNLLRARIPDPLICRSGLVAEKACDREQLARFGGHKQGAHAGRFP